MIPQFQSREQQSPLLNAIIANALQPNNHELLRHLGQVLGLKANSQVLLIAEAGDEVRQTLEQEFNCQVEVFEGPLRRLPFASASFDATIVAIPLLNDIHTVADELSRVLKASGSLGMVTFSIYREHMPDDDELFHQVTPLVATTRPAAAYRAVLAEAGFTAFVMKDRRRDLRRAAQRSSGQAQLQEAPEAPIQQHPDLASQAIGLLATGGVGVVLITAEKGL